MTSCLRMIELLENYNKNFSRSHLNENETPAIPPTPLPICRKVPIFVKTATESCAEYGAGFFALG